MTKIRTVQIYVRCETPETGDVTEFLSEQIEVRVGGTKVNHQLGTWTDEDVNVQGF